MKVTVMEIKTHALLLSLLVVTGAMTIDAYAQSNTQRIETIDDNTSAIKMVVDAINTMVSSMSSAIEAISSSISGIESTLTSVNSSVDEVKSSVATISADVATIKSSITGFDAVAASIGSINNKITSIEDRLIAIETSIVSNQGGADSTSLQILSERMAGLSLTIAAIDDQLDAISAELGVIKNTTTTPRSTPAATGFFEGTTTKTITNYDYKQHGKKTTVGGFDRYELDMTFTCSTDVFLDTADMDPSDITDRTGTGTAVNGPVQYLSRHFAASGPTANDLRTYEQINYVTVDGRTLYHNNFVIGSGSLVTDYVEYDRPENFENRKLTAGMGLKFETQLYDGEFGLGNATAAEFGKLHVGATSNFGTVLAGDANERLHLILNATKDNPKTKNVNEETELYTVEVTWNSYNAATCSISIGGAASAIGADTPYSKTFGAEISGDSILKTFENTLDCGGNPLTITGITGASGDDDNLANFGTLGLTVLDGNNDDTADVAYKFGTDWELSEDDDSPKSLPLTVSGHDVKISGTFPGKSLIIQLEYNSVPNAGCTINK